ncbi:MAG: hypothetical protein J0H20_21795, partial [Rhizobiales bacterium]|nr:hypothetical protein [Hyphomicrobiales bacterium]
MSATIVATLSWGVIRMLNRLLKFGLLSMVGAALALPLAASAEAATVQAMAAEAPATPAAATAPAAGAAAVAGPEQKPVVRRAKSAPKVNRDPQVYLFRGLANVFSLGMDRLDTRLKANGVKTKLLGHTQWASVVDEIVAEA